MASPAAPAAPGAEGSGGPEEALGSAAGRRRQPPLSALSAFSRIPARREGPPELSYFHREAKVREGRERAGESRGSLAGSSGAGGTRLPRGFVRSIRTWCSVPVRGLGPHREGPAQAGVSKK